MPKRPSYWGDRLTAACLYYWCVCGLVALGLDFASYRTTSEFQVASPGSEAPMACLCALGTLASGAAVASRPTRIWLLALAVVLALSFACGTAFGVCLWVHRA